MELANVGSTSMQSPVKNIPPSISSVVVFFFLFFEEKTKKKGNARIQIHSLSLLMLTHFGLVCWRVLLLFVNSFLLQFHFMRKVEIVALRQSL
jgi:hypothetical protein